MINDRGYISRCWEQKLQQEPHSPYFECYLLAGVSPSYMLRRHPVTLRLTPMSATMANLFSLE